MKKGKTGKPFSEAAKLITGLYRRRLTTHWSEKEIAAFLVLENMGCFAQLDDLNLIIRYYEFERKKGDGPKGGIHRRDLDTFLNRYLGELDRANLWAEKNPRLAYPKTPVSNAVTPEITEPEWDAERAAQTRERLAKFRKKMGGGAQ